MSSLTRRQQICVMIALHYAAHRRDKAKALIRKELERGAFTVHFFSEIFIHLSLILGFPVLIEGLDFLTSMRKSRNPLPPLSRGRREEGLRALRRVYGNQTKPLLTNLRLIYPGLERWIVTDVYGRVISRKGLWFQDREILNVTVLAVQGLEKQLYSHIRGAMRAGVSAKTLRTIVDMVKKDAFMESSTIRLMIRRLEGRMAD